MKKVVYVLAAVILALAILSTIEVQRHSTPWIRGKVTIPVFTVGDESFARDLAAKKQVVKYGPMFFGLYKGGEAFAMIQEAVDYLKAGHKDPSKWGVYLLSGDYLLDVKKVGDERRINKTLLVINQVAFQ